jgi:hypothetical protein
MGTALMAARPDNQATRGERRQIAALVLLAALVRLPLLLTAGYDVWGYKAWARGVHEVGIGRAYAQPFADPGGSFHYPPLFLYILRVVAALYAALRPGGTWTDQLLAALLKIPPIAAELGLGVLLWAFLRRRTGPRAALLATAAYLCNPALIWNTAYWGSIDSFHALLTTGALVAVVEGAAGASGALAALAVGSKLTAIPGVLVLAPPLLRTRSPHRIGVAIASALVATGLLLAPIVLRGQFGAMRRMMFGNLGLYPAISANAHNFWWLVTGGQGRRLDTDQLLPGLDYRLAGLLLFALVALAVLLRGWQRTDDTTTIFASSALLTFAFCLLTTEVHENWAYPLFAPLLVAAALDRRYRPLYAALSLTFLANLALQDPPLFALLGDGILAPARPLRLLNSALQCALLAWWLWLALRPVPVPATTAVARQVVAPAK